MARNKLTYIFIITFLFCTLLSGCSQKKKPYNLILISIDALRADHLGIYGYHRNTSPTIDAFAKKNILFTNFHTVVPKTGPSMTSFFTGRYVQHHGVTTNALRRDKSIKTLTQILPKSFHKAAFCANLGLNKARGYADGFDEFTVLMAGAKSMREESQAELTPKAINWLKDNAAKGNFFLWLHYLDPHGPYTPPPQYKNLFINDKFYDPTKKVALDYTPLKGQNENIVLGAVPKYQRLDNHNAVDYYISQYDAEIRYTDAEIKKLFNYLKSHGLMKKTIIVITADHGESLGEKNYYFEHGMFVGENSTHIPLIIHHPDITRPMTITSTLESIDLAPTLLSEYGLHFPQKIDGLDFSSLYHKRETHKELRKFTYSCTPQEYTNFIEIIRTKRHKIERINEKQYYYCDADKDDCSEKDLLPDNVHSPTINRLKKLFAPFGRQVSIKANFVKLPPKIMKELKGLGYVK